jgi:hypothetical protein
MEMDSERENEKSGDRKAGEDEAPLSKAAMIRKKLMLVAGYMMDGFAPVVAVTALIVAVMAFNGNRSGQTMAGQSASRLESMNVNLTATKSELEKLKTTLIKDKAMQDDERKKLDERLAKIIQAISQLQAKAKVSPTLEEQLNQPAAKAAVLPPSATSIVPAVATASPAAPPGKAVVKTSPEKKTGEQATVLKDAIDKFNKK